uniref:Sec translocon accessory complex subunit YajC n=2 Tax=unclassified Candidatus Kentrum TaxID=2643149 RepID=A0A451A6L7_9GAMM|nr:MAG: preprotein translocase subunit YajC [Candidatus Kentron sp. LPFa]VFK18013.1 MAG: preprotein translocase subunit YajC [Candidatus Kentron sp. LPFa]VFK28492.1 MAG: preprotein translocase subunit YajC [Candidatus Kentron sp. LPFa]VFK61673.1 MAG: preprotein translocase subunit YajC [Candidatus Kentron sp. UNK]VFK68903.1 MAG: preprotein translocase subunit YajC [Candidatus Kentron sp. UNK]
MFDFNMMNFFVEVAHAESAPTGLQSESGLVTFLPMILLFALLWFLLIRPQQKRAKEHRNMVSALSKDDEVVTSGGILGRIIHLNDNFVTLEVADSVEVTVQRHAVASSLPKGTVKAERESSAKGKGLNLKKH